jgi:hypothetical protein
MITALVPLVDELDPGREGGYGRVVSDDEWQDSYWQMRRRRWIGRMWGPIPYDMIMVLSWASIIAIFYYVFTAN